MASRGSFRSEAAALDVHPQLDYCFIAQRYDWGRDKGIHALALRVRRLPEPVELPVIAAYAGCKSWIELETDVNTAAALPVEDEAAFARKLTAFRAALTASVPA